MSNKRHIMVVKNEKSQWEEEVTEIFVDKESCFYETHEEGWHDLPRELTQEELEYHGKKIIERFNKTLRPHEQERYFVEAKIVETQVKR